MQFALFILTALAVYSFMHLVMYWGLRPLLINHPAVPTITWVWMALMTLAPFGVRLLERVGMETPARALAWVGFSWMGVAFLAFSLTVVVLGWEALAWIAGRLAPSLPGLSVHGAQTAAVILFVTLGATLYGFMEASTHVVEKVSITSDKLDEGRTIRIAQVSDIHLGLVHREEMLAPIVAHLKELQPDLLLATGDIVDAQINHIEDLAGLWQELEPPLGKYAVTGNHEYYAGLEQSLDYLERSGFKMLRDEWTKVVNGFVLAGVDDRGRRAADPEAELEVLTALPADTFRLFMKHKPSVAHQTLGLFDLQLSGHTHRGQIYPFNYLVALVFPMQDGLYRLAKGSTLYTSRGTGTWGPPMRVLSPPEITLVEITGTASGGTAVNK